MDSNKSVTVTFTEIPPCGDVHDVEAVSQTAADNEVEPGDIVDIYVTVANPRRLRTRTKFRATSFFVVDELPLGTIVTLAIPFGFLSFVAIKKKANTQNQVNVKWIFRY